jgi:hypothetical protein
VLRDAADADEILHVLAVLKAQTHTPKSEVKRSEAIDEGDTQQSAASDLSLPSWMFRFTTVVRAVL